MSLALPQILTEEALKSTGIHIGQSRITKDMERFVSSKTPAGLALFDINKVLDRISVAGKYMSREGSNRVLAYSGNPVFANALKKFQDLTGIEGRVGRWMPGTITNPQGPFYRDIGILLISSPLTGLPDEDDVRPELHQDARAMDEASGAGIPVIALCNSNTVLQNVDVCVPCNNLGPRAIATVFYLLSRAVLVYNKKLQPSDDLNAQITDFETIIEVKETDE